MMPWKQVQLRGQKVFAHCQADGTFTQKEGRVEIRYGQTNPKPYFAYPHNLQLGKGGEILPEEHCASMNTSASADTNTPVSDPRKKKTSASSASKKTAHTSKSSLTIDEKPSRFPETGEEGKIIAFADGACQGNPGPCGLGVVILTKEKEEALSEYLGQGTNNVAELTGVLRIFERLEQTDLPLEIYTDSKYTIGVVGKDWKAKANKELIESIRAKLKFFPNLKLLYVPGHQGVLLNEKVDQLARDAVETKRTVGWLSEMT